MAFFNKINEIPLNQINTVVNTEYENGIISCVVPVDYNQEFCWVGIDNDLEEIQYISNYVDTIQLPYYRGYIITSVNDINLSCTLSIEESYDPKIIINKILTRFCNLLTEETKIQHYISNNDIINETGKVLGFEYVFYCGIFQFGFSLSLTNHKETIDEIGLSYSKEKTPSYITIDDKESLLNSLFNIINTIMSEYEEECNEAKT